MVSLNHKARLKPIELKSLIRQKPDKAFLFGLELELVPNEQITRLENDVNQSQVLESGTAH